MRTVGVGPLPARLLSFTAADGELVPAWLTDRDRPWLRDLLRSAEAASGRPLADLERRWQSDAGDPRAGRRAAIAQHVVLALLRGRRASTRGSEIRQQLFAAAARGLSRAQALAAVAARFCTTADAVATELFADLPHERRAAWPEPPPESGRVLLLGNLALAQGMLRFASAATLRLSGGARAVLRTAWLHGAHFRVGAHDGDGTRLEWQPHAPSRRAARALAAIVPLLPWARRHELRAHCCIRGQRGTLVLATGDPILPGPEPRAYDSALERAFAADFAAAAPAWQLLREPVPLLVGDQLAFPDFELRHPATGARWLLEIAGLRAPGSLAAKLALLAAAPDLLLCLPRAHVPPDLLPHPRIVPFARRIDPAAVLRALGQP